MKTAQVKRLKEPEKKNLHFNEGLREDITTRFETLDWADWFNNRQLLEPIGHIPHTEHEASCHQCQKVPAMVAGLN